MPPVTSIIISVHPTSPDSIAAPSSPLATSYPRRTSMPGAAVKRVTGTPCRWGWYGRGCSAGAARTYALAEQGLRAGSGAAEQEDMTGKGVQ